ncbi:MAG: hypothetical protein K1X57_14625 [Gemmataceae bacterium]|nr:hypothetical protein [Gemmataceae bacterium]
MSRPVRDVTCTACGCLCDDIVIAADDTATNACRHGQWWFDFARTNLPPVPALIGDSPASIENAIAAAGQILARARFPLVLGGAALCVDGQRALVGLADALGAAFDSGGPAEEAGAYFPAAGSASSTWGEVVHRADLIVYWNVPLDLNWWRHRERVLDRIRGRREVAVVSVGEDVPLEAGRDVESIWTLRSLVQGKRVDAAPEWETLAGQLRAARYAVIVHHAEPRVEIALQMLARDVNESNRCRVIDLGSPGNSAGLTQVSRWQSGFGRAVGFHRGFPVNHGREFSAERLLTRGEVDAVVSVGQATNALSPAARDGLLKLPHILIAPSLQLPIETAQITLFTLAPGIHSPGAVFRSDGLTLPLRPVFPSSFPPAEMVINGLREEMGASEPRAHTVPGMDALCSPI